jgi:NTE family protein
MSVETAQRLPRQIVTLGFLSDQIHASFLSEQLAGVLGAETESDVVLVRLQMHRPGAPAQNGHSPGASLNGEFHLPATLEPTPAGFCLLNLAVLSDPPSPAGIDSLVDQLSRRFRHVLIQTPVNETPDAWFFDLVERSDHACLFLNTMTEGIYHLDLVMREVQSRRLQPTPKPIACLAEGQEIDGFDLLAQKVAGPMHAFVRGCPMEHAHEADRQIPAPAIFRADVRRLAREIGGCLIGLALSSGAAKGFAHIGVIQVLEENGIEVDVVAGSSMGAYVGALWAYGNNGQELEALARQLEAPWALWTLVDPVFPPRQGFLRGFAVKKRLMRTMGRARFADLVRPLRVVAANLATLERKVFSSGEVAAAVHASIAVPGICVPVTLEEGTYVDGGIVDPLPVEALREMGAARIIAVDVIPTPDRIRYAREAERELAGHQRRKFWRRFRKALPLERQLNLFACGNLFEILMRSLHGAQIRMAASSWRLADLVLRPDICDDRWLDYRHPGKFIALGRQAAERHLEEIKALVTKKESDYERKYSAPSVATVA